MWKLNSIRPKIVHILGYAYNNSMHVVIIYYSYFFFIIKCVYVFIEVILVDLIGPTSGWKFIYNLRVEYIFITPRT